MKNAGIKNKPDRLNAEDINIDIEAGTVDFSFTMNEEGNPKVMVYNIYGDKVFNSKPESINGSYHIKIDLSTKQQGTYYLQVVSANASFTKKFKL